MSYGLRGAVQQADVPQIEHVVLETISSEDSVNPGSLSVLRFIVILGKE
jgi:hypothetical protein